MILVQQFQEAISPSEPRNAGTQTQTRARTEASDQDAFASMVTKISTAKPHETATTDFAPSGGAIFPRHRDPDSYQQR